MEKSRKPFLCKDLVRILLQQVLATAEKQACQRLQVDIHEVVTSIFCKIDMMLVCACNSLEKPFAVKQFEPRPTISLDAIWR